MDLSLEELPTPALVLDRARLEANCASMRARADSLGVRLRPHLKTAQCAEVAALALGAETGPIAVATLREARYFRARGFSDVLYAVALSPGRVAECASLELRVIVADEAVARAWGATGGPAYVEIDVGQGRTGVRPESDALLRIAGALVEAGGELVGVLAHAGQSYGCANEEAIAEVAERERAEAVQAAERLRAAGHGCPEVSVGSTPTATFAAHLEGVTELRPGVYMFQDLFQRSLGCCTSEDLALSVVATVIGADATAWIDAGALALSQDASLEGYGAVTDLDGGALRGAPRVTQLNQEHGRLEASSGTLDRAQLWVGAKVRVWPNHACMTAAMHRHYWVLSRERLRERWERL